jgi:hypothetical protein
MKYKDIEVDISKTNFVGGVAIIPLPDESMLCIPEEGATQEELEIIQQIKEDVAKRPVITPEPGEHITTSEERIDLLQQAVDFILTNF